MQSESAVAAGGTPNRGTSGCPECGGQIATNGPETVCADCGLVVDEQWIDHGPGWRSFETDQTDPKRTGAPLTEARHDRDLSTEIGRLRDDPFSKIQRERGMGFLAEVKLTLTDWEDPWVLLSINKLTSLIARKG